MFHRETDTEIQKAYKKMVTKRNRNRILSLLDQCKIYQEHLDNKLCGYAWQVGSIHGLEDLQRALSKLKICGDRAAKILVQKYEGIVILINILERDKDSVNNDVNYEDKIFLFNKSFNKLKSLIGENRNNYGMIFIKSVLTILSLGLAVPFGLWKTEGDEVNKKITDILDVKKSASYSF